MSEVGSDRGRVEEVDGDRGRVRDVGEERCTCHGEWAGVAGAGERIPADDCESCRRSACKGQAGDHRRVR